MELDSDRSDKVRDILAIIVVVGGVLLWRYLLTL